ncbi:uncharacterized protein [Onthophagus taurus]|uniref:uncharacterized protein isoform X1 n=2 Tax=Onthophagus taurus TaxID=166361 RepID=UPI0039BDE59B
MVQPFSSSKFLLIAGLIGVIASVPIDIKKRGVELYDQKQTGKYNIRINLKDITIIDILGGDYNDDNYEYDYEIPSDYTDFPIATTTSTSISTNLSSSNISINTALNASTVTIQSKPLTTTNSPKTTTKTKLSSLILNSSTTKPISSTKSSTSIKITPTNKPSSTTSKPSTGIATSSVSTTLKPSNKTLTYSYQTGVAGDRIPVIVLQQNQNNDAVSKSAALITSQVTIVPDDGNEEITERVESLGEIHYKKCPNGLIRDKNGICRKLKRPPLFDISRFTSGLVSKFRRQDTVTPGRKTNN